MAMEINRRTLAEPQDHMDRTGGRVRCMKCLQLRPTNYFMLPLDQRWMTAVKVEK